MKRKTLLLLWLFPLLGILHAQDRLIDFEEYDLDNGLHVILHQDNSVPIVTVSVMYHVGSKDENPDRTGFAHFFEHLMFEGSEYVDRGEFDDYIDNAGGMNNASTTQDRTYYFENLPSNQLNLALWLESERMLHAKVDAEGIETQREVVKEEKRLRIDNQPYGSILEEVMKRAYTQSPYRWTPIGSMEHLDAASDEDYVNFYETFYSPNNATLTIAGDIDIDSTKEVIDRYFSGIPRKPEPPRPDMSEPAQTAEIRDTVYDNIQLPAIIQAHKVPGFRNEESYAVEMLMNVLSRGESSRLNKELRDKKQLALQVIAVPLNLESDPAIALSLGIIRAGVELPKLEEAMIEEYQKVREELITEEEFQKVRNQIETQFYSNKGSMAGIASALATYHVLYGDTNLINTELERYMAVTREDIREAARKYLVPENRVTLYYLPKSEQAQ